MLCHVTFVSIPVFYLGDVGRIINDIMNSHRFKVNAMMMCRVEQANAEEFYEVSIVHSSVYVHWRNLLMLLFKNFRKKCRNNMPLT